MDVDGQVEVLAQVFAELADPAAAADMKQYMRGQFEYFGLRSPDRRAAQKPVLLASRSATEAELVAFVDSCWKKPQREFQYSTVDVLRKNHATLTAGALPAVERWITTKPWWDTIDFLSPHIVGSLVRRFPELVETMDAWVGDDNIWLVRSAILHQLMYKHDTNAERLFSYCDQRARDEEFFIQKALGWALRQYARYDAGAVSEYVEANETQLSSLTKREALKHLK